MSFYPAATRMVREAEAFDDSIRSKFQEYQNLHRAKFKGHLLPSAKAELYLK